MCKKNEETTIKNEPPLDWEELNKFINKFINKHIDISQEQSKHPGVCPNCGYCPVCGKSQLWSAQSHNSFIVWNS